MCGIAGYIGETGAAERVFSMLKRLEYRGYDSAGVSVLDGSGLETFKDKGRINDVRRDARLNASAGIGIGHTRWATHGPPSKENAHPHSDSTERISIVHNGIIENYKELKKEINREFKSETDTEVIAHLIEQGVSSGMGFEEAFVSALKKLDGSFALVAIMADEPDKILFARHESPLIIGIGDNENFIASDIPALLAETKKIIILDDGEYGVLGRDGVILKEISTGKRINKEAEDIEMDSQLVEKEGHSHFMIKEILEEPTAIRNSMRGLEQIREVVSEIECDNVYFVACGTAYYASLVGRYVLQEKGVCASSEIGSEFRYSTVKSLPENSVVIAISQSGETADTIGAVKEAKKRGLKTISIVNVVGSTLARLTDHAIYTYSGPEIAVASTKAYVGQVSSLLLFCFELLRKKGLMNEDEVSRILGEMEELPSKMDPILDSREVLKELAGELLENKDFFYLARGINVATANEGALKMKEISYLHAEAYPGGELKHGPLALLDETVSVIAINPKDSINSKMTSNIQEARTRGAKIFEINDGNGFSVDGGVVTVPKVNELLSPLVCIVPLHLIAYYASVSRGVDPDFPRNLAKSVTVE